MHRQAAALRPNLDFLPSRLRTGLTQKNFSGEEALQRMANAYGLQQNAVQLGHFTEVLQTMYWHVDSFCDKGHYAAIKKRHPACTLRRRAYSKRRLLWGQSACTGGLPGQAPAGRTTGAGRSRTLQFAGEGCSVSPGRLRFWARWAAGWMTAPITTELPTASERHFSFGGTPHTAQIFHCTVLCLFFLIFFSKLNLNKTTFSY